MQKSVKRLYIVLDLSLLRGESREEHLTQLVCSIARAWICLGCDDEVTFGFSLYDSQVGGYMLNYQLSRVASDMGIPKHVAATTASDLNREDIVHFLSLVRLVTDREVVEGMNLRSSRNSRSSDVPAVELCKVLRTVLKSEYLQKLLPVDSNSSDDIGHGLLLLLTPSIASEEVPYAFVGVDALRSHDGKLAKAVLSHIPLSIWKKLAAFKLGFCWVTADQDTPQLYELQKEINPEYESFLIQTLTRLSENGCEREDYAKFVGLPVEMEACSSSIDAKKAIWTASIPHNTEELLQIAIAQVANSNQIAPLPTKRISRKQSGKAIKQNEAPVGRGHRAMKNARVVMQKLGDSENRFQSSTQNQTNVTSKNTNSCVLTDITPATVEQAVDSLEQHVQMLEKDFLDQVCQKNESVLKFASEILLAVRKIVASSFHSISLHREQTNQQDAPFSRDVFLERIKSVDDIKCLHKSSAFEEFGAVAAQATLQLFLRLCIGAHPHIKGEKRSDALPSQEFQDIESIMQIIVATMRPIPIEGQKIFLQIVKPNFEPQIPEDIKLLEKTMWDEEELGMEGDGSLVEYKIATVSIEASGETPDDNSGHETHGVAGGKMPQQQATKSANGGRARSQSCKEVSVSNSVGPGCSAEGSGIHGGVSSGAVMPGARRGRFSHSDLAARRFNNSKQYKMHVKIRASKRTDSNATSQRRQKPSAKLRKQQLTSPGSEARVRQQVPATPQEKQKVDNEKHGMTGPQQNRGDVICSTPQHNTSSPPGDIVPNTSPREQRKGIERRPSIRQPVFDIAPGAIIQSQTDKVVQEAQAPELQKKHSNTWLASAAVPRNVSQGVHREQENSDLMTQHIENIEEIEENEEKAAPPAQMEEVMTQGQIRSDDSPSGADDGCNQRQHEQKVEILSKSNEIQHTVDELDKPKTGRGRPKRNTQEEKAPTVQTRRMTRARTSLQPREETDSARTMERERRNSTRSTRSGKQSKKATKKPNCENASEEQPASELPQASKPSQSAREHPKASSDKINHTFKLDDKDCHGCSSNEIFIVLPCSSGRESTQERGNGDLIDDEVTSPGMKATTVANNIDPKSPSETKNKRTGPKRAPRLAAKRRAHSVNKTPGKRTKRGRLAGMLAGPSSTHIQMTPRAIGQKKTSLTPKSRSPAVEDRGSPCKPSPFQGTIMYEPSPERNEIEEVHEDSTDHGDSCMGDTPEPFKPLQPLNKMTDCANSDEQDAAILNAAATGELSPSNVEATSKKRKQKSTTVASNVPLEPDTGDKGDGITPKSIKRSKVTKQLHLSEPPAKENQIEGVPKRKDELICHFNFMGQAINLHCEVQEVESASIVGENEWTCTLRVIPTNKENGVTSLSVQLQSSGERPLGSPLIVPNTWSRIKSTSPLASNIRQKITGATVAHQKAVRQGGHKISPEGSIPILDPGRRDLVTIKISPRRRLRPCHLKYAGDVLKSAEKIQGTPLANVKRGAPTSGIQGVELFPTTADEHQNVSPEATAAAGHMLGALYGTRGSPPLTSPSVKKLLSPHSTWMSPQ